MRSRFSNSFLALAFLLLFSGCFETEFNFKTTVHQDGTVERQTHIDGRGANLFKVPDGKGWQAKVWETQGQEALLPATYHHIEAHGKFASGETVPPDYQFDQTKLGENWQERNKERL